MAVVRTSRSWSFFLESLRIVPLDFQKSEEPRLVDAQRLFDGRTLQ
jgi:hypothetical protein